MSEQPKPSDYSTDEGRLEVARSILSDDYQPRSITETQIQAALRTAYAQGKRDGGPHAFGVDLASGEDASVSFMRCAHCGTFFEGELPTSCSVCGVVFDGPKA